MTKIWSEENKFQIWFNIEAHACDAQARIGSIPASVAETIWKKGRFEVERINQIEREVKHDVIAFLTNLSENIGPEARFIHQGLTSSDVLDTCLSLQLVQASDIILQDIELLLNGLKEKAYKYKDTVCVGRSHGIHAEPTTIGLKFASLYCEFDRNRKRLETAKEEISSCAISGAVGTFSSIDPSIEKYVSEKLGLKIEKISTQIIPRDRHAAFFSTLAVIASSIERTATEIRHMQRTEVREAEEHFSEGQKGSSAMPHKRNPVLSENLTGLSRIIRSYALPALENVALWHERDISHSSVERMIGPDATITLDFAIDRLNNLINNLIVYPEQAKKNLEIMNGLIYSQRVMLSLTHAGLSREEAYQIVQRNAMKVWGGEGTLLSNLKKENKIKKLLEEDQLEELFSLEYYLKHVDTIFNRVFED